MSNKGSLYLVICEGGDILTSTEFTDTLKEECDAGITEVICISTSQPIQYHNNSWYGIDGVGS